MSLHHADEFVSIDTTWCPGCRRDCTVEIVQLPGDPQPVIVCLDCGGGIDAWWNPGTTPDRASDASVPMQRRFRAS